VHRRVITEAPDWLAPTGHLLVETSVRQASVAQALMTAHGLTARITRGGEADATVVHAVAGRPPARGRSRRPPPQR
jgi:release factor glutamine methyltransferase